MVLALEPLPAEEYAAWRETVIARRTASPRSRGLPAALAASRAREVVDKHLPPVGVPDGTEVLAVLDGGRRAGTFFLLPMGDAAHLGDLQLVDPATAPVVRELVVERLRGKGVGNLGVGVTTGDPADEAFVDGVDLTLVATQMQLDLATAPSPRDPGRVTVRPMTADEVAAYLSNAVETFADENMAADPSLERDRALKESRELHDQLLPQGMSTPGHEFLVALDAADGRRTGFTWLFHEERAAFVYDVEVDQEERGRGYGRALMDAATEHARDLGMDVLGLNVFGHNDVAASLYEAIGYEVVDRGYNLSLGDRDESVGGG